MQEAIIKALISVLGEVAIQIFRAMSGKKVTVEELKEKNDRVMDIVKEWEGWKEEQK